MHDITFEPFDVKILFLDFIFELSFHGLLVVLHLCDVLSHSCYVFKLLGSLRYQVFKIINLTLLSINCVRQLPQSLLLLCGSANCWL
jgi:hypothetical protein